MGNPWRLRKSNVRQGEIQTHQGWPNVWQGKSSSKSGTIGCLAKENPKRVNSK